MPWLANWIEHHEPAGDGVDRGRRQPAERGHQQHVDALQGELGHAGQRPRPGEPPEVAAQRLPLAPQRGFGRPARHPRIRDWRPPGCRPGRSGAARTPPARSPAGKARPRPTANTGSDAVIHSAATPAPPTSTSCSALRSTRSSSTVGRIARYPRVAVEQRVGQRLQRHEHRQHAQTGGVLADHVGPAAGGHPGHGRGADPHGHRQHHGQHGDRHQPGAQAGAEQVRRGRSPAAGPASRPGRSGCPAWPGRRPARRRRWRRRTRPPGRRPATGRRSR